MANYTAQIVPEDAAVGIYNSPVATLLVTTVTPQFAQRVWSTGLGAWCYYVGPLNPTPSSAETTPNWTGSIQRHESLGPA